MLAVAVLSVLSAVLSVLSGIPLPSLPQTLAAPYGIESFDDVLEPLWKGIRLLRGKVRPGCKPLAVA